jgi:hypothetical protein
MLARWRYIRWTRLLFVIGLATKASTHVRGAYPEPVGRAIR